MPYPQPSAVLAIVMLLACAAVRADAGDADAWWQRLQALCGNAYAGTLAKTGSGSEVSPRFHARSTI